RASGRALHGLDDPDATLGGIGNQWSIPLAPGACTRLASITTKRRVRMDWVRGVFPFCPPLEA
ncbi:MAG TPA: hypothetical protein VIG57_21700, partial [Candidatus Entotheonella sp.]